MTQKEINKFLANTKVYVNGKSKEIQEKLFSLGYEWNKGGTDVLFTECPFLYIDNNHHIKYGSDMCVFSEHKYREISFEEILFIKIEPTYRPFKSKEECWQEMQKHEPFGWIYDKNNNVNVSICFISKKGVFLTGNVTLPFDELYDNFVFDDRTPFGVKEEE